MSCHFRRFLGALTLAALTVMPAHAQRVAIGLHFVVPFYYWPAPYYYPPVPYAPYWYAPFPAQTLPPPVVVERERSYWYYCPAAKAYYPYVRECPQGWQRVPTVPPA